MAAYTAVDDAGSFFSSKLYTGTGSSLGVTGAGFQPDIAWIKNRDTADFHVFANSLSGATKYIETNDSLVQTTNAESVKSFDSDGFTVGTQNEVNTNTEDYVSWNWKMGTTGTDLSAGSITPSSSTINTTAGVGIYQYTGNGVAGATIAHGLGAIPKMMIVRNIGGGYNWMVYHEAMGATKQMKLNTTAAETTVSTIWNDTAPTATLFSVGTNSETNQNTDTLLAYLFCNVQGFSKFGSYGGNASADGPFCFTGFTPAYVMLKNANASQSWQIYTWDMQPFNEFCAIDAGRLKADLKEAASIKGAMDMLSNGFKIRTSAGDINTSGQTVIWMAFAESPFVNSEGVPANAR